MRFNSGLCTRGIGRLLMKSRECHFGYFGCSFSVVILAELLRKEG